MTPKDLYQQIEVIYNNSEYKSKLLINNFMIIFQDNYYLCYHELDNGSKIQFRLEVNFIIPNIGHEYTEYSMVYDYKTEQGSSPTIRIDGEKNIPEPILNIIKPVIRQFKLDQLI